MEENVGNTPAVVFDFDGTLTVCDSLFPFLRYAVGRRQFWSKIPSVVGYWLRVRLRRMDRALAKEAVLAMYLRGRNLTNLETVAKQYADRVLPSLLNQAALARLDWHRQNGHRLIIVSASLELYLRPWAKTQALPDPPLGTKLHAEAGIVTGRLDGANCVGAEKVRRLDDYLGETDGIYRYAYGDSRGDWAMLERARHPYYRAFSGRLGRVTGFLRLLRAIA